MIKFQRVHVCVLHQLHAQRFMQAYAVTHGYCKFIRDESVFDLTDSRDLCDVTNLIVIICRSYLHDLLCERATRVHALCTRE